jgi:hypothetical protein
MDPDTHAGRAAYFLDKYNTCTIFHTNLYNPLHTPSILHAHTIDYRVDLVNGACLNRVRYPNLLLT